MSGIRSVSPSIRYQILNLEPQGYSADARAVLATLGTVHDGPFQRRELLDRISAYDVLIVRLGHQIDQEVLDAGKHLKVIVSATTGLDHIDLEAAQARGIVVMSLKGEQSFLSSITATAEHTWGLLLALVRRITEACDSVKAGYWDRDAFKGHDLAGKRLGIVGLGRLGKQVAAYGAVFRMSVNAFDPRLDVWPETVMRRLSLRDLAAESDVLSLHVHLAPDTVGLVGKAELEALPRGAVLLNTSRGHILDEGALLEALESGHLAGAALDVLTGERSVDRRQDHPLLAYARRNRNLLITPHIGGATHEAMARTEIFMAHKLADRLHAQVG